MSTGVNKVLIVGNLTKDPEVRYAKSGSAVLNMTVACNERRKDGDNWKDHCEFVSVAVFGKTAENCGQYLKKGRQVFVEGKLETTKYKNKEGVDTWSTKVVAFNVLFLGGGDDRPHQSPRGGGAPRAPKPEEAPSTDAGFIDDDLPFVSLSSGLIP